MQQWTVEEYANNPQNIFGKAVSTTSVYSAIEAGRLKTKQVGKITLIEETLIKGLIQDRVLVKPDKPKSTGFATPEHTVPKADTGEVIHLGNGIKDGQPMILEPGMRVLFNNNKISYVLKKDGEDYFVLHQPDIIMIL